MGSPYAKWPEDKRDALMSVVAYLAGRDPEAATPEGKLLLQIVEYLEHYERRQQPRPVKDTPKRRRRD